MRLGQSPEQYLQLSSPFPSRPGFCNLSGLTRMVPDLTVTSAATAEVGDTVVVKGILQQNQDFGYGYKYDLIIQDAEVTVEE